MDDKMELSKPGEIQVTEVGELLKLAINKDLDTDKLKAIMDLSDRREARIAEKEFELHFAEMQKEYIPAYKTRSVKTKNGTEAYSYCPLPEILKVYSPILSKHGFTYRWTEQRIEGDEKRITCFLTGYGHTRDASIELPFGDANLLVNRIQARGITTEYGRRYTFVNVTGCIVLDEDKDGKLPEENLNENKKQLLLLLPYLPPNMRDEYAKRMDSATSENIDSLIVEVKKLKLICQDLLKHADVRGGVKEKQKVMDGIREAKTYDAILDWSAYVENL